MKIRHLYISSGHNFYGHKGRPPGDYPTLEVPEIECVAGRGIKGDRFFDYKKSYQGQATFFSDEVFDEVCGLAGVSGKAPGITRRNIVTSGVAECSPCHWMDEAIAPGAKKMLHGRGGLRARILTDGKLRVDV